VLLDMFGGVPLVTSTEVEAAPRVTRDSLYKFVESELRAAREGLPEKGNTDYGRMTKGAADAILANMYLNAPVFQGTVSASGLTRAAPRYQEAITAVDRLLNSGKYRLATDWRSNFSPTNESSDELIFVVNFAALPGLGNSFPQRPLHYNQHSVGGGPWNGFATIAETYRAYDPADQRRTVWLQGRSSTSSPTARPPTAPAPRSCSPTRSATPPGRTRTRARASTSSRRCSRRRTATRTRTTSRTSASPRCT
jgi:hypothetical protein